MTLSADQWIAENHMLSPEKLHAIGVVAFQWNQCEYWLLLLLRSVSKIPRREIWAMAHDMGDVAMCEKIETFVAFRGYHADGKELIENALQVHDLCRQNRNSIVHAQARASGRYSLMARRSKKPDNPEPTVFRARLIDVRRVADEIEILRERLWLLCCLLDDGRMTKPLASPEKLPLPERLWKPSPQDHAKRPRQP